MICLQDIRQYIVSKPDVVRGLCLGPREVEVFRFVSKKEPVLASEIADAFDLQPSNASMVMRKLFQKGYVYRESVCQESGGYEYQYRSCL